VPVERCDAQQNVTLNDSISMDAIMPNVLKHQGCLPGRLSLQTLLMGQVALHLTTRAAVPF
jgi:hypothetical protein